MFGNGLQLQLVAVSCLNKEWDNGSMYDPEET